MTVKRFFIFAPILLIIVLLQSYFWEPTYEEQTKGNPARLTEYITGSIGDASLLNPVIASDSASGDINGLVFEGLIDYNKDLRFRGRVAKSWEISEQAFFYVNPSARIPEWGIVDAASLATRIKHAQKSPIPSDPNLTASLKRITNISVIPPRTYTVEKSIKKSGGGQPKTIRFQVTAPARIKLVLNQVDQHLFQNLAHLLGKNYFESFRGRNYLTCDARLTAKQWAAFAKELIPATEHNPILLFHLRPGVKFQDGYPVSAEDVKFTYEAIMNPKNLSPLLSVYEPVKTIEVIDPLTVKIVYKRLYSPALSTWGIGILPKHLLDSQALKKEAAALGKDQKTFSIRQSAFNRHPVGCGPFKFQTWKSDQYIILDRFHDYWEGPPNYHQYVYRIIPDPLTQEMEFYAGTLDSYNVEPHQVMRLEKDPRFQHFSGTSFGYTYIGYNERRKPFDDPRVRRALGMAIDINKIIKYVLYGQGERITGPFVKQTDYYDHKIKPLPYDPQGALKLLAAAGWKRNKSGRLEKNGRPLEFTLITNNGNELRKAVLAIAQDAWKQIGIDIHTDILEWSVFIQERINKLDFDAVVLGWGMDIQPDLFQIWHSSQTHPYQLNFVGFKNKRADELIIKIRQEYNHARQVELCHKLHALIADLQPYTFLYVSKWTAVLDKRIVIKTVDASGAVQYKKITPTKTGNYRYYFNQWVKLPQAPQFMDKG
ncbi:MAG: ABC transporter substrate-binding protein [Desulfobacterales bacterium]|jgi:ABC-type transport system substrate-binding protein|nr:ABC transporter substrate-binding protein [Desulfobacterales bacterium]